MNAFFDRHPRIYSGLYILVLFLAMMAMMAPIVGVFVGLVELGVITPKIQPIHDEAPATVAPSHMPTPTLTPTPEAVPTSAIWPGFPADHVPPTPTPEPHGR